MFDRRDEQLVGPLRSRWGPRPDATGLHDEPIPGFFRAERAAISARSGDLHERVARQFGERVDLSVWVRDRRTHGGTAVLEGKHVLHVRARTEGRGAFAPQRND